MSTAFKPVLDEYIDRTGTAFEKYQEASDKAHKAMMACFNEPRSSPNRQRLETEYLKARRESLIVERALLSNVVTILELSNYKWRRN